MADPAVIRPMGERRFGRVNWLGLQTLVWREVMRFANVWTQTVLAPIANAALFLIVFSLAITARAGAEAGEGFLAFLVPGILMMQVISNAFANTSSSIMISKIQGNIVDTLMPPLNAGELLVGYMLGGVARGTVVALVVLIAVLPFTGVSVVTPLWLLVFVVLGSAVMALVGMLAGIYAEKFDQMATLQNFVITPLSFLSGTFYSVEDLPPAMATASHFNPMFYMIDGARHGVLGHSDASPWLGMAVLLVTIAGLGLLNWRLLARGYRLKS